MGRCRWIGRPEHRRRSHERAAVPARSITRACDVTFLIGENGCGKSTLLEGIAVAWGFNPEGGGKNFHFSTRVSHSALHRHLRLVRSAYRPRDGFFLRTESFFNVATTIDRMDAEPDPSPSIIGAYGGRSLHEQSHGESFLARGVPVHRCHPLADPHGLPGRVDPAPR